MVMKADVNGSRTHEPSLRELTAEMDGLRQLMSARFDGTASTMDERDRRYEDRFTAMDEKTSLALTASEKAVVKAETATEKRFDAVNEFRGTLSDQATNLMPRAEAQVKFIAMEKEIAALKDEMSRIVAGGQGGKAAIEATRSNLIAAVAVIGLLVTLAMRLLGR